MSSNLRVKGVLAGDDFPLCWVSRFELLYAPDHLLCGAYVVGIFDDYSIIAALVKVKITCVQRQRGYQALDPRLGVVEFGLRLITLCLVMDAPYLEHP